MEQVHFLSGRFSLKPDLALKKSGSKSGFLTAAFSRRSYCNSYCNNMQIKYIILLYQLAPYTTILELPTSQAAPKGLYYGELA